MYNNNNNNKIGNIFIYLFILLTSRQQIKHKCLEVRIHVSCHICNRSGFHHKKRVCELYHSPHTNQVKCVAHIYSVPFGINICMVK